MNVILLLQHVPHNFNNSTILKNRLEDLVYLNRLINNINKFVLIFRGSRNGFSATAFHKYCDKKGPTITFILDTKGQIFGGYTTVSWQSVNGGKFEHDSNAFLFSLTKK